MGKDLRHFFITSSCSHFFNKTDFQQCLFKIARQNQINILPKSIRNKEKTTRLLSRRTYKAKTSLNQLKCDLAVRLRLLQNLNWAAHYYDQFSVLARGRTQFHLAALEAFFYQNTKNNFMLAERLCLFSPNSAMISRLVADIQSLTVNQSELTFNLF